MACLSVCAAVCSRVCSWLSYALSKWCKGCPVPRDEYHAPVGTAAGCMRRAGGVCEPKPEKAMKPVFMPHCLTVIVCKE